MVRSSYTLNADHMGYFLFMLVWIILVLTSILYVGFSSSPGAIWLVLIGIMFLSLVVITYKIFTKVNNPKVMEKDNRVLKYSKLT